MDLARRQVEKYGWKEGQALGKNESDITKPIKTSLKFDNTSVDDKHGVEYTNNWWETTYDKAVQNLGMARTVKLEDGTVKLNRKPDTVEITTRNNYINKEDKNDSYKSFLKISGLISKGPEEYCRALVMGEIPEKKNSEELFPACGGLTSHNGAQHGIYMRGKLERIAKQEKMLLKKMKACSIDDNSKIYKKMKKLKSHKETIENEDTNDSVEPFSDSSCSSVKKKKKKSRKSVSFNDTVLEYQIPSSESSNLDNIPNPIGDKESLNTDEGIEKDIKEDKNQDNDVSGPQFIACDLSKAEKKKLKKKRKLEGKQRATAKFIQSVRDEDTEDISSTENCKKRKLNFAEAEFSECKRSQSELGFSNKSSKRKEKKKKKHKKNKKSEKYRNSVEQKIKHISASLQNVCKISEDKI